ncbi:protein phosphatase 2C domain-containing protein [Neobacillus sp. K501]
MWVGSQESFIDNPNVHQVNHVTMGRYGGNSQAGQVKNEDGCLVWTDSKGEWEFTILLDAHYTAESAELVLQQFALNKSEIKQTLALTINDHLFKKLEEQVTGIFQSEEFLSACRNVTGETACLIVARKGKYIWWFSVGDCILYLFHPELAAFGQYPLNQRQYFEWIGQVNTFAQKVPCYSCGRRELRKGLNHLFLTTDGLIECPNGPFLNPSDIFKEFTNQQDDESIRSLLLKIQENHVRDSTTIISWNVYISEEASIPSDQ